MDFRVLGPVALRSEGRWHVPSGRLQQTLLGLLLARAGHQVSADSLGEALWGEEQDDRRSNRLHVHVHRLRSLLDDPDRLVAEADGYRLSIGRDELDAGRFEAGADRALSLEAGDPQRIEVAREALAQWTGTAFGNLDDQVCRREAERLEERRLVVTELLLEEQVGHGRHVDALPELAQVAGQHPLRETLQGLHMRALQAAGRQTEALEVYRRTRTLLVEELGVDPSAALQDLHEQVLAGSALEDGRAATVQVPAQLPVPPTRFSGRDTALRDLDEALGSAEEAPREAKICVVAGTAGVGKTALVLHWAHQRIDDFPDGQLFADLRGFSPVRRASPSDVLDAFIRALGTDPGNLRSLEERTAQFRSLVTGRRLLVVLDNARDADQVRPLLPGTPTCRVVVTSRDALPGLVARDGAQRISVEPLAADASELLLGQLLGPLGDQDLAGLARRCAHLPLALRVAAERLRAGSAALDEADDGAPLELLDGDGDPDSDVRRVFSWSYEALDPAPAAVFRAFGVLPGRDTDWRNLSVVAERDPRVTRRALRVLTRAHLVHEEKGRYSQHDLLREYAAELVAVHDASVLGAARARLLTYQVAMATRAVDAVDARVPHALADERDGASTAEWQPDADEAHRWLLDELDNVVGVAEQCADAADGAEELVLSLSETLRLYLRLTGHVSPAMRLHDAAVRVARRQGDELGRARALDAWGRAAGRAGLGERAHDALLEAVRLARDNDDTAVLVAGLNSLAGLEVGRGAQVAAVERFEEAYALALGVDPRGAAVAAANAGLGRVELEQYDQALETLDRGLVAAGECEDAEVAGFIRLCLAQLWIRRKVAEPARDELHRAEQLLSTTGLRSFQGDQLDLSGQLMLLAGRDADAAAYFRQSLAVGHRSSSAALIVSSLRGLALTCADSDPARADLHFSEALGVARNMVSMGEEVHTRRAAAEHKVSLGDHTGAVRHLELAVELLRHFDDPRLATVEARLQALREEQPASSSLEG